MKGIRFVQIFNGLSGRSLTDTSQTIEDYPALYKVLSAFYEALRLMRMSALALLPH